MAPLLAFDVCGTLAEYAFRRGLMRQALWVESGNPWGIQPTPPAQNLGVLTGAREP